MNLNPFKVPSFPYRVILDCPDCGWSQLHGSEEIVQRLRTAGLLRSNSDATREEIVELLRCFAGRLACPECQHAGLLITPVDDEDEGWPGARVCETCGRPIPRERVEAVPTATLCAACQSGVEQGAAAGETEYCRRCGSPMVIRPTRSTGITRYEMACSAPGCRG